MGDAREVLRYVQAALDEFDGRLRALEDRQAPWRASVRAGVEQRRRVVVELRESGLSYSQIAAATGCAVSVVERDLQATPHRPPERVLGIDRKSHPTSKNGSRPTA